MVSKNRKSYLIAVTGCIGSGKTTVSNILREYGYYVFDTDLFSKEILDKEKIIIRIIEDMVNQKVSKNSKIDFRKIGKIFDDNPILEEKFENWYQIFLGNKIAESIVSQDKRKICFFDIPLLSKKGITRLFDYLWIIDSKITNCYERVKKRNNYSKDKIHILLEASKIDKDLFSANNYKIIYNNDSIEKLRILIKSELRKLESNY